MPAFRNTSTEQTRGTRPSSRVLLQMMMVVAAASVLSWRSIGELAAQGPTVVDPNLGVRTVVASLQLPTAMAFLGANDFLVIEKATGRVRRVVNGSVQSAAVLDLDVNSASERGLLGIALDPHFPSMPFVYLYWTESTSGGDSNVLGETTLLGNRVDRFLWDGTTLTMDRNLIRLRALQDDVTNGVQRGNHDGGVIRFGPDGKLYIFIGDVGRRGQMQNLCRTVPGASRCHAPASRRAGFPTISSAVRSLTMRI